MSNFLKPKISYLLLVGALILFAMLTGCNNEKPVVKQKDIKLPEKVKIGVINSKTIPPQVVYGFSKELFKKEFPGVEFELEISEGHHDVGAKLGDSEWDLAYVPFGPTIEFVNYGCEVAKKTAKYTILAGAQFGPNNLVTNQGVALKDFDGKTVGITNKNNDKEMVLNKLLAQEGLKTEALGGTVKVKYDSPGKLFQDFQQGKIFAVYPHPSMVSLLVGAGSIIFSDGTDSDFGNQQTFAVFTASNKFLKEYPEFTQEMVRIHVETTDLAKQDFDEMVDLTHELETTYFKGDPKRVLEKDRLKKLYKKLETTYDPNIKYVKDSYKLLEDAGYIEEMPPFEQWADFSLLEEVLKEKGLDPIK